MIEKDAHPSRRWATARERTTGRLILCGFLGTLFVLGYVLHAADDEEHSDAVERFRQAEEPAGLSEAHRELFADISARDLMQLVLDDDDGVALAAAWQHVRRTMPKEPFEEVTPDPRALNRFLGRVEGRLRVMLPSWWEQAILNTRASGRDLIGYTPDDHLTEWDRYEYVDQIGDDDVRVWLPWDVRLERVNDRWRVSREGESIDLPMGVWEPGRLLSRLEVQFVGDRCYVAAYGSIGWRYSLYCLDRADGKVLWKAPVWGAFPPRGTTGVHDHWMELVSNGDHVLLFGVSLFGAYIEAFDPETGENKFRFGTLYFWDKYSPGSTRCSGERNGPVAR